mgnify:CR=1 FL=1
MIDYLADSGISAERKSLYDDLELLRVYGQLDSAKTQRDTMGQQLEEQKKENSDLESDLGKANDKEFIKGLAKDQLGLAEVGERIFYDVNH